MPMPAKRARNCTVNMLPVTSKLSASGSQADVKKVSLFEQKRLRGFWPCISENAGQHTLAVCQSVHISCQYINDNQLFFSDVIC